MLEVLTLLSEIILSLFVCFVFCACAVTRSDGDLAVSHLVISELSGSHMQLTTLLEPWPTSLIWLTWDVQTATPAPARQWDTEPTSSHLNKRVQTIRVILEKKVTVLEKFLEQRLQNSNDFNQSSVIINISHTYQINRKRNLSKGNEVLMLRHHSDCVGQTWNILLFYLLLIQSCIAKWLMYSILKLYYLFSACHSDVYYTLRNKRWPNMIQPLFCSFVYYSTGCT